ncbi:MAG: glutamine--fructose-6-phosphate transaminase (isomerizing) [Chloroflexi bacterium]|nr:glutamine--fructose-6-phosphate transaminase (isomerizing) [Chloroflexota bacterium]
MCGIVGYVGSRQAAPILVDGLTRLEYRGYDSAGIAVVEPGHPLALRKTPGKLSALVESLKGATPAGFAGIGHTRWATHGSPTQLNAHPHTDCSQQVVIVHNGIVENYLALKEQLLKEGHTFTSETDSEVIAHLFEASMAEGVAFEEAVRQTAQRIQGAQAVVAMNVKTPGRLVAFRLGNAGGITVGYGDGEMFLASDLPALLPHTSQVAFLAPGEMVTVEAANARFRSIQGPAIRKSPQAAPYDAVAIAKEGYRHFMLKEIMEQPGVVQRAIGGKVSFEPADVRLPHFPFTTAQVREVNRVVLTGMGSSLHACMVARYYMEQIAGIPAEVDNSSELRYRDPILDGRTLLVSVSQSGETADTLGAMEEAARQGAKQITICNVEGSQSTRMAHGTVFIGVGPEIGVASTKCLIGSLAALYLLAVYLGKVRGALGPGRMESLLNDLATVPRLIGQVLEHQNLYQRLAHQYADYESFLYLGRGINMPVAMEGALKMKEISYIHAEGYPAGEMKHGPIALIDKNMPVVALAPRDALYDKMRSNIQEVKARGGKVIALVNQGQHDLQGVADDLIEAPPAPYLVSPMVNMVPMQLLAYHIAVRRGCDVDQPRNLAKTVTVE